MQSTVRQCPGRRKIRPGIPANGSHRAPLPDILADDVRETPGAGPAQGRPQHEMLRQAGIAAVVRRCLLLRDGRRAPPRRRLAGLSCGRPAQRLHGRGTARQALALLAVRDGPRAAAGLVGPRHAHALRPRVPRRRCRRQAVFRKLGRLQGPCPGRGHRHRTVELRHGRPGPLRAGRVAGPRSGHQRRRAPLLPGRCRRARALEAPRRSRRQHGAGQPAHGVALAGPRRAGRGRRRRLLRRRHLALGGDFHLRRGREDGEGPMVQ